MRARRPLEEGKKEEASHSSSKAADGARNTVGRRKSGRRYCGCEVGDTTWAGATRAMPDTSSSAETEREE